MRNLLAFLAALVLTVAVVGYFLGWYRIQITPGKDGTTTVNIKIDNVKATEDVAKGTAKVNQLAHDLASKERKDKADSDKPETKETPAKREGPVD
jgi:hypothetical protein